MHANNDVVQKLQDTQMEYKAAMDMMSKQLPQIATSLSEMRGNEGRIRATVKPPDRANVSQVTLRSGRAYEGPMMKVNESIPPVESTERENEDRDNGGSRAETGENRTENALQADDLRRPLPRMADPFFLDPEPEVEIEEMRKKIEETSKDNSTSTLKRVKPFPYRGEAKKKKDDTADLIEIFGKLKINLPFLQALKMPTFSKFIKEFIARRLNPMGRQ